MGIGAPVDGPGTGAMGLVNDENTGVGAGPEGMGMYCALEPESAVLSPLPRCAELEPTGKDAEGWAEKLYASLKVG
jgi:hypothetical protein